ncbi:phosphatidate cytidylyltransferase [Rubellimicrobium sp. CFH 75288]|uniref:phosphatidate cytidylyltransferase n=1 Tax=Rubellimicrobium sp. CFH 75288 TaxID=2697034 RepID=UPI001412773D|nr:phosphatidate cytidylyltransferase [Rubellimicrobium sp. CFH 75288]NAZ36659.1 phosphatidate cytidylyltransferase [Rubellimicrobium sp. CFH 75288]
MTTTTEIVLLALGVFAILTALTALGESLRARVPAGQHAAGVETFNARIRSWWIMAALFSLALLAGRPGLVLLFALASFAALREFATYTAKAREDHAALALAFFLILPLQFLFVGLGYAAIFTVLIPVHVFLILPVLSALGGSPRRFLTRVAETQWALMTCVYGLSHVPALLTLDPARAGEAAVLLVAFLILTVQGAELTEAVARRRLGGPLIAPEINRRTWAGVGAGVAAGTALGGALAWLTPFPVWQAALLAGAGSAMGLGGTMALSAIKREHGLKDWSDLIPGQGGVLDGMGGVIFAAPLFFHLCALLR